MESTTDWATGLIEALGSQLRTGVDHLPSILGATVVLVLGWLLARMLRRATQSVSHASNRFLNRVFPSGILAGARMSPFMTTLVGEIVFWSVVFLALTAAARVAGLNVISEWLDQIAVYLPNLIAAFAIVVIGYFLSIFVRQQPLPQSAAAFGVDQKALAGRVAQGAVITIALIMGLDQLGIDVLLPVALLAIAAAAIAITFGVSIALGARSYMSNLIGMRSVRGHLTAGLRIRVNGVDGQVLEVTPSQIMLETDEGKALIPGRLVSEFVTIILAPAGEDATNDE